VLQDSKNCDILNFLDLFEFDFILLILVQPTVSRRKRDSASVSYAIGAAGVKGRVLRFLRK
jgi:hypothetical protein